MRAIILAAGMGTRLRPLTLTTPKSLIKINGQPILERQIEFLIDKGIEEIIVVTGYLHEKFDYLKDKYNVTIVHNEKFKEYNNIYTMYLVRKYLGNSYVIDADVYLNTNFIDENINKSTYFIGYKSNFKNEWVINYDQSNKVEEIIVRNGDGYILSGVSYWSKEDAKIIVEELEKTISDSNWKELYWDDIVRININKLNIYSKLLNEDDSFEIDSLEDLEKLNLKINKIV